MAHNRGVSPTALRTPEVQLREVEAESASQRDGRARHFAWLAAGLLIGALSAGLAVYALSGGDNNVAASPSPSATASTPPTTRPASTPTPLPTLPANGPVSIGKVFTVPYAGGAVCDTSPRAAFTVVSFWAPDWFSPNRRTCH